MATLKEKLQTMEPADKTMLAEAAVKYTQAKQTGSNVDAAYTEFVQILKHIEVKYDAKIFVFPSMEKKIADGVAEKLAAKMAAAPAAAPATAPAPTPAPAPAPAPKPAPAPAAAPSDKYICTFQSIAQANSWLSRQTNLVITAMHVDTNYGSLDVRQVRLECITRADVDNRYQITEIMKHRIFAGSNHKKFCSKWQKKNPNLKYVSSQKSKWAFNLFGGGIGFFRYVKEKYILLYTFRT